MKTIPHTFRKRTQITAYHLMQTTLTNTTFHIPIIYDVGFETCVEFNYCTRREMCGS